MLNYSKDEDCIMSSLMAKCTGLHYVIDPKSPKLGGHNVFHLTIMAMIAFTVACVSLCPFGLYHWANDMTQCLIQLMIIGNFSFGCFKAYMIVRHSDDIRRSLDVTRFDFVSSAIADPDSARFFRRCRNVSATFTGWFAAINHFVLMLWTLLPFVIDSNKVEVKNRDGSFSYYHFNPYNLYFLVSSETYNEWHLVFHLIEWMFGLIFILVMILFDTWMVTLCIAITCQMKGIADAYRKLGHCRSRTAPNAWFGDEIESADSSNNEYVRDLKLVIKHHQAVLGKMNDFYKIVGPVILPQLIVASFTIIFVSFIITRNYFNGMLLTSTISLKMCCCPTFFFQIYYTCLVFGNIDHQKNVMNFALYSCDWTHMEIKFKKLLLLAMEMHDAYKVDMKLTAEMIVNLELFTSVINLCYSIFSVLVNSQLKIVDRL
nr:odorant receptor 42 [Myzus persicae]